jgi:hypothetical protein
MYEMSKVDKASGLKNQRLVLVNRPSVGKSNSRADVGIAHI